MLRMGCEQVDELKRRFALVRAARAAAELEVGAQTRAVGPGDLGCGELRSRDGPVRAYVYRGDIANRAREEIVSLRASRLSRSSLYTDDDYRCETVTCVAIGSAVCAVCGPWAVALGAWARTAAHPGGAIAMGFASACDEVGYSRL